MQVTLKLYGNIKRYAPNQKEISNVEIENGRTIRALLDGFGVPDSQVWMSAVNDNVVDDTTELHDGDVVEIFEPIGGGSSQVSGCKAQAYLIKPSDLRRATC